MDHSGAEEMQVNSAENRRRRWNGDGVARGYVAAGSDGTSTPKSEVFQTAACYNPTRMENDCSSLFWLALLLAPAAFPQQQFAALGDFKLESGGVLQECRIGYRTFGSLNSDQSNVILFPTWAGGTTEQLSGNVGAGKLVDSSKYYVILVDALSNGVSSSPSNSKQQPHMHFPKITIRDMVNTQHDLLTKVFHLQHVKAVVGISMGGMQTFQWMTAYPGFMDKAVAIVGSPRLAPYDLLLWQAQIDAIQTDPAWHGGDYDQNPARAAEYEFGELLLTTPEHYNRATRREQVLEQIEKARNASGGSDANDKIRQCEAMMSLDVSAPLGRLPSSRSRRRESKSAGRSLEVRPRRHTRPRHGIRPAHARTTSGTNLRLRASGDFLRGTQTSERTCGVSGTLM